MFGTTINNLSHPRGIDQSLVFINVSLKCALILVFSLPITCRLREIIIWTKVVNSGDKFS